VIYFAVDIEYGGKRGCVSITRGRISQLAIIAYPRSLTVVIHIAIRIPAVLHGHSSTLCFSNFAFPGSAPDSMMTY